MNRNVIEAINNSPWKAYFAITGGGQTFIGNYMSFSGASKTVIGAIVPYSQYAFDKFVKWPVESYASAKSARQLAVAAYNECIAAGVESKYALGLGCACSLAKDGERKDRVHKIHVAVHTRNFTREFNGDYDQGRTRQEEECNVAKLLLHALNRCTVQSDFTVPPHFDRYDERTVYGQVYSDVIENPDIILLNTKFDDKQSILPIYSGSWNPLHQAHEDIARIASTILGAPTLLELSICNADKGQIDHIEIDKRVQSVTQKYALAVTNTPTFVEKARRFRRRFPNDKIVFIVGVDTWNRIWDAKYAGSPQMVEGMLEEYDVQFLVFGRNGIPINKAYGERLRIRSLLSEKYDHNISSTELRKQLNEK